MNVQTIFSALSDPTRFAIVEQLLEKGDQTAGSLAEPFNISKPAISRHLKVLEEAGVIERRVDRQFRSFRVRPQSMRSLDDWIGRYRRFWQTSFDRLEKVLQDKEEKEKKDDDQVLYIERTIAAPPEKVFDAWVNPDMLVQWWGPEGMSIPQHKLDVRVGGVWETTMRNAEGGEVFVSGIYKAIERPNRLVLTWAWQQPDGSRGEETEITVTFESVEAVQR